MTRIASVKAHAISAKLKHTLWTAHEELHSSSVILVEIKTDDGLTGIGQIHEIANHRFDLPDPRQERAEAASASRDQRSRGCSRSA